MTDQITYSLGRRLRQRRRGLQISQAELGAASGVSFQQIHKYETGQNRISAARLWTIAKILDAPIDSFFTDTADGGAPVGDSA